MPPGRRSCHDEHPNPLQSASSCKLCWLYCTNPVYNRFWGGNGSVNLSQVPCRHLGKDTKERVPCGSCRGKVALKVFECALYQRCLPDRVAEGIASCVNCPDHVPGWEDYTPYTPVAVVRRRLENAASDRPTGWARWENTAEAFRLLFDEASRNIPSTPHFPQRRGIVICGGGWRFFPSTYVTVRMIRQLGCQWPIQIWYLGDRGELQPPMQELLAPFGVSWVDGNAFWRDTPGVRIYLDEVDDGWLLKPLAAAYCPFREVISLDADCYPVRPLDSFLSHPSYQQVGAAFWPDLVTLREDVWERFGIECDSQLSLESGQFIVDKSRHWEPLWLALWLNAHHDYVWRHVYGDKDTFNLAWKKLGRQMCVPTIQPGWLHHSYLQKDINGETLFVHRTRGKFRLRGEVNGEPIPDNYRTAQKEPLFEPGLPLEAEAHRFAADLEDLLHSEAVVSSQ